ncbi:MAG: tetratricopeptide repeat protein, partial [Opitutaceae bacterium]
MSPRPPFSTVRAARIAATCLLLAGVVHAAPAPAAAQPPGGPKKELELDAKTREALGKLKPLQDAQNYAGMLALIETIPFAPNSYDEAMILDMKAKIYGMTNQLSKAIAPWERAVQLSDKFNYFPEKQVLEIVFFLGQLYAQEATTTKDAKLGQEQFTKALTYFKRFMDNTPKPKPEAVSTYAMLLYYKAVADPKNPDQAMLKEARTVVERGLTSAIKPKESFYQLLLALQQQQNDLAGSAEILELLLKQNPNKKDQWQMLMALYLQLSEKAREKDPALAREYLVRAIVTAERAQKLGFQNTPKDNMTLVSLYLMANQFTKGTELLYNGMKNKTIESEPHNWRILGRYYQEADMNEQAVAVLKEASALFPKNGEIEVQIAQIYIQMEKSKEAFEHAKAAVARGNFEGTKPYSVHYLIAYTAYELGRMDDAYKAIQEAEKFEESRKDPQFARLKEVVTEAIAERDTKT